MEVKRFEIYWACLDPTIGREIKKTRPCVIVSPDAMNRHLGTVIVAPLTTHGKTYVSRIYCKTRNVAGKIVLDQLRTLDRSRLGKKLGVLDELTQRKVLAILAELFAE